MVNLFLSCPIDASVRCTDNIMTLLENLFHMLRFIHPDMGRDNNVNNYVIINGLATHLQFLNRLLTDIQDIFVCDKID